MSQSRSNIKMSNQEFRPHETPTSSRSRVCPESIKIRLETELRKRSLSDLLDGLQALAKLLQVWLKKKMAVKNKTSHSISSPAAPEARSDNVRGDRATPPSEATASG
jgi:hypothetical protein